jgi:alpha-tubulin suppressor-like RCC1 family protein
MMTLRTAKGIRMRRQIVASVTASIGLLLLLASCSETALLDRAQGCSLSSECKSPLVCAFAKCSQACKSTRDCPPGDRCVQSDRPYYVCRAQRCARNSECEAKQVCAADGICHDQCLTQKDCLRDQVCAGGACADTNEVTNGTITPTTQTPGIGQRCVISSDCPGELSCLRGGVCGPECIGDKDCKRSFECRPASPGGPGRCFPRGAVPPDPAIGLAADGHLSVGGAHTCALLDASARIKCWGVARDGELGYGDPIDRGGKPGDMGDGLPFVDLGINPLGFAPGGPTLAAPYKVVSVHAGAVRTCAVLSDGRIKCWGLNNYGQLGLGDKVTRGASAGQMGDALPFVDLGTGRTVKSLAVQSYAFSCAILDNNQVKCWGGGALGALGTGNILDRGDQPGEMGDALPYVDLGTGRTAKQLATMDASVCAILDNNQVKCWGSGYFGLLGSGNELSRGAVPGQMGDAMPYVDLGTGRTAKKLAAGDSHICALLDNNQIKCWGKACDSEGPAGMLGLGECPGTPSRGGAPNQMGDNLPAIQLGTGRSAKNLATQGGRNCALLDNNQIKCWGAGGSPLGYGDTINRGELPNQMGDNLPLVAMGTGRTVLAVRVGSQHTCAVLDNGVAKCWGSNFGGELGLGDTADRGGLPGQMGDALPTVKLEGP